MNSSRIASIVYGASLLATPAAAQQPNPLIPLYTIPVQGEAFAPMPDLDGDSVEELILGIPSMNRVEIRSGASGQLLQTLPTAPFIGAQNSFGHAVVYAGMLAGKHRLAVGDPGSRRTGRVHLYEENAAGIFQLKFTFSPGSGGPSGSLFGWSLAAGDVGQSGPTPELVVGAPGWRPFGTQPFGLVEVWDVSTLATPFMIGSIGARPGDEFGYSVATTTSYESSNPDNAVEIVVGAPQTATGSPASSGYLKIYDGATLAELPGVGLPSWEADMGYSVADVGQVSSNGTGGFAAGFPNLADDQFSFAGVYETFTAAVTVLGAAVIEPTPPNNLDERGTSVSSAGDYDSDGFQDYLAGAPAEAGAGINGSVFVVDGDTGAVHLWFTTGNATRRFGSVVNALDRPAAVSLLVVADPEAGVVYVF